MSMKAYLFYYMIEPILLYGYTLDKKMAKRFKEMRDPKSFKMVIKEFSKIEFEEGFDDPMLEKILGKRRGTYEKRLEIMDHPFTDGYHDFMIPSTILEMLTIDAKISTLEDISVDNFRWIDRIFFKKEFKELLVECNKLSMYDEDTGELMNAVDAFQLFVQEYGYLLKKDEL